MCEHKKSEPATPQTSESSTSDKEPDQSAREVKVNYRNSPPARPPGKEIHPRQIIPAVPEGKEVPDDTPSPPVEIE
jgi:hypothetical protein